MAGNREAAIVACLAVTLVCGCWNVFSCLNTVLRWVAGSIAGADTFVGGLTQIVALNVLRVAGLPGGSFVVLCGRAFPILL